LGTNWLKQVLKDEKGFPGVRLVVKRNGTLEKYNREKISGAILKAVAAVRGGENSELAESLTR